MKKYTLFGLLTLFICLQLAGCGGGGGEPPRQQKTAIVTFGVISTATLPAPISGVMLTAQLPAGVTVATVPGSHQISPSVLAGLKTNGWVPFGSYSASRVTIPVIDNSNPPTGLGFGDLARLTCDVTPGMTLSENDFTSINNPFPIFEAFGFASGNSVDLAGKTKPTLNVTFGY